MLTLFGKIAEYVLGHKYYAVVLEDSMIFLDNKGNKPRSLSGYIFRDKESAKMYFYTMKTTRCKQSIEMVSFRSRKYYEPFNGDYKINLN